MSLPSMSECEVALGVGEALSPILLKILAQVTGESDNGNNRLARLGSKHCFLLKGGHAHWLEAIGLGTCNMVSGSFVGKSMEMSLKHTLGMFVIDAKIWVLWREPKCSQMGQCTLISSHSIPNHQMGLRRKQFTHTSPSSGLFRPKTTV